MHNIKIQLQTLVKFGTVGVGNTLLDFGVFFLLNTLGIPYIVAQIFSYGIGMVNSYVLNRKWTFEIRRKTSLQEIVRFIFINVATSAIAVLLLFISQEYAGLSLLISKCIATIGGLAINFIGSRFWVFQNCSSKGANPIGN